MAVAAFAPAPALATISTVAGVGIGGYSASDEGAPATAALIDGPRGVAWMPDGGFVFADFRNERVRRVSPAGTITTLAGNGATCAAATSPCGDGGPAPQAQFDFVHGVAVLGDGSVVIADTLDNRIRRVDARTGIITTVAGTGAPGFSGDGGPATAAAINGPRGVATRGNDIYIPDSNNGRVRRVAGDTGRITTVAGGGLQAPPVTGGPAVSATLAALGRPFGVGPTADGGLLIADQQLNAVFRVWPDGSITRVAGQGVSGSVASGGDTGAATSASVSAPHSVVEIPPGGAGPLAAGGFLIAEMPPAVNPSSFADNRVRYVAPDGIISTVVNRSGIAGSAGDGGPADAAQVNGPRGLAIRADGAFLIAEFGPPDFAQAGGDRVRLVTPDPAVVPPPPPPAPPVTPPVTTDPVPPPVTLPPVAQAPFTIPIPSRNRRITVSAAGGFRFTAGPLRQAASGTLVLRPRGPGMPRTRRLASASLRAAAGRIVTVRLRLGPGARRALARRRSLAARATVTLAPAGQRTTTRRFDLVLVLRR